MDGLRLFMITQLIGWPLVIEARFMATPTDGKKKQAIWFMGVGGAIITGGVIGSIILSLLG